MSARVEAYLARFRRELRKHGVAGSRIIAETREHLIDAIDAGLQRGISVEAAESEAFARFGTPEEAAKHFAEESCHTLNRLFFILVRAASVKRKEGQVSHYHDTPPRVHVVLRPRRLYGEHLLKTLAEALKRFMSDKSDLRRGASVVETDQRNCMDQFLREFGRRRFGTDGTLESLTLLDESAYADVRESRYLAAFGIGTKMIWTVVLSADGTISFDGTYASA